MKIRCSCGAQIIDSTDGLATKAHVIGDKDWNAFWDRVDAHLEAARDHLNVEELMMDLRRNHNARLAWECSRCGRIYFDRKGEDPTEFVPLEMTHNAIFGR